MLIKLVQAVSEDLGSLKLFLLCSAGLLPLANAGLRALRDRAYGTTFTRLAAILARTSRGRSLERWASAASRQLLA